MDGQQDREFTLGTGKLLGLFFGLAALCALFFGIGFSLGRGSNPSPGNTELIPSATTASAANKPSAAAPVVVTSAATQAVSKQADPAVVAADPAAGTVASGTPPEVQHPAGSYVVQVAAISKQQDAEALAAALKSKNYAVFIAPQTSDNLFHVQIGPFADSREADTVRARLIADGYNPIVKR